MKYRVKYKPSANGQNWAIMKNRGDKWTIINRSRNKENAMYRVKMLNKNV